MSLAKLGYAAVCVSGLSLMVVAYFVHRDLTSKPPESYPSMHESGKRTIGDDRVAVLTKITRLYVSRNVDVTPGMKSGAELAPVSFLNQELELEGEKWRVREAHGLIADTYNVM
jgi:hypothetical protein